MQEHRRYNKVLHLALILGDLAILNLLMWLFTVWGGKMFWCLGTNCTVQQGMGLMSLCYMLCSAQSGVILYRLLVSKSEIVLHVMYRMIFFIFLSLCMLSLFNFHFSQARLFGTFYISFIVSVVLFRITVRYAITRYRKRQNNLRRILLLGGNQNILELYEAVTRNPMMGFQVIGYFDDEPYAGYPATLRYLGTPADVLPYLDAHTGLVDELYCNLPSVRSAEIMRVINYCEGHIIRFYSVPNLRNYLKRRMHLQLIENVPILSIRREPLMKSENRLMKRAFDICVSGFFLCTAFPFIYLIIGALIKISSPGPIFFKQKRNGVDGKEFWCYKFRSMKVNVDCDSVQAKKDDPRKTKIGNFIRRTNIDEIPQLINVLRGNMSLVGPRPHMLKHTAEYRKIISKYMVRHQVKPGITGWAQVTGFRGETDEIWQMEGRVERDIWYLEHWTFLLDLYIIYLTIANMIRGDKAAY
ncbi:MAG: undecaprenyl-phosphate glucose phosphotransferase [Mediterranea sp.]|jgi:putative colanic acid biosynthesis UDP-glucose lipid carrier transferase|nr:undecaprenyl-phosphate glucose phosphotransferase [Mediterranea sp.]